MRVILADDAAVIRAGLARLLEERGCEVVAEVGDPAALVQAATTRPADVAVVDIRMPPTFTDEGLRAAELLRRLRPQLAVLLLSQHVDVRYAMRLVREETGSVGYLLKDRIADVQSLVARCATSPPAARW